MGKKLVLAVFALAAGVAAFFVFNKCCDPAKLPPVNLEQWWGPNELKAKQDKSIRPFKVEFSESMVKDLLLRLNQQRPIPPSLEGVGFSYGFNSDYLKKVVDFWRTSYNFKEREAFLNQFPQFKTNIQGMDIHFIHVKPKVDSKTTVVPLLMLHGWPGSVREFYEVIAILKKPSKGRDFAFELIVPNLPGFGFSEAAVRPGLGTFETGIVMRNLMQRLGHKTFYIQAGDWGSVTGAAMATIFPNEVLGFHSNMILAFTTCSHIKTFIGAYFPSLIVEEKYADRMYPLSEKFTVFAEETGYFHLQATKPDTIGVALADSPAGLAAYILDKYAAGTNINYRNTSDGGLTEKYKLTDLLDNIMVHWSGHSITTSMRFYAESFNKRYFEDQLDTISTPVPTWALKTRYEIFYQPDGMLRSKFTNLLGSTVLDYGGHFAAFELPEVMAEDVWQAVAKFIEFRQKGNKTEL